MPAHLVRLSDGTRFNVCPHAGVCARFCYAKVNTYRFGPVLAAHTANLELTLNDPARFAALMVREIGRKRNLAAVRIHDAGDFYSADYFRLWCGIAATLPEVLFYAYTKEVAMTKAAAPWVVSNLVLIYSMGGTEDHLVDRDRDRHADVFPSKAALEAAGYFDQGASDLLAATAPSHRIGIVANNVPQLRKRQGLATFSERQAMVTGARRRA